MGRDTMDLMLKAFYGNLGTRYSCFDCPSKGDKRSGDFTIFDSWNAKKMAEDAIEDNKGYTNVIIHSLNGSRKWNEICSNYTYYKVKAEEAIFFDGVMYGKSSKPSVNRNEFYSRLSYDELPTVMKKLMPITMNDRLRVTIKKMLLIRKRIK